MRLLIFSAFSETQEVGGWGAWPPTGRRAPMLEHRIDKSTLISGFLSVKATHFAVLSEKLPLFTVLLILNTQNNECFSPHYDLIKTDPFLQNLHFSTLNDDSALKKSSLSHRFFSSSFLFPLFKHRYQIG